VPREGVKTAHPLLILSTTYDPVCALAGAKTANEAFVDSRLVEVKAFGHCSLAMPSLCVARHVRAFLEQGTMPAPGATCEIDVPYFGKRGTLEARAVTDDERVLEAQGRIADGMLWVRG
jgi:hypothetical protein